MFRRGQEPKEAMQIGLYAPLKKGDKFDVYVNGILKEGTALSDEVESESASYTYKDGVVVKKRKKVIRRAVLFSATRCKRAMAMFKTGKNPHWELVRRIKLR